MNTYTFIKELVEKISNPRKGYVITFQDAYKCIVDEKYYNAITEELEGIEDAVFLNFDFNSERFIVICDKNDEFHITHVYVEMKYDI